LKHENFTVLYHTYTTLLPQKKIAAAKWLSTISNNDNFTALNQTVPQQFIERQYIEPIVDRNESLLNFSKLNTSILNRHMQCVHW